MLYLIEDRDYLKIGYTKDIDSRWKNYQLHNCYAKLITTKEGSRTEEARLHELCKPYLYKGEWYHNCQEVFDIFNKIEDLIPSQINSFKKIVVLRFTNLANNNYNIGYREKSSILEKIERSINNGDPHQLSKWFYFYQEQEKFEANYHYINKLADSTPFKPQYKYNVFFNKNIILNISPSLEICKEKGKEVLEKYDKLLEESDIKLQLAEQLEKQNTNDKYDSAIRDLLTEVKQINTKIKNLYRNYRNEFRIDFIIKIIDLKNKS